MKKRVGGVAEAAKLLEGLDPQGQQKILETISQQDPKLAEALRNSLVTFDDLQFATVKMIQELLREIDINDLGMALRLGNSEVKKHFLAILSSSLRLEIEEVLLGPPVSASKAQEATVRVMEVVRRKVSKGELILKDDDEYV